ncbi:MAG: hypothetical protein ACRDV4_00090 [Acidimicrobiales bacterium]
MNGKTTPTCGTSGAIGSFVVENTKTTKTTTVEVTKTTKFFEPSSSATGFTGVCIGTSVDARGTTTSGTFSATLVTVLPGGWFHPNRHGLEHTGIGAARTGSRRPGTSSRRPG